MAAKESKDFIFNDDSVLNSYGFRVMTDGIQLDTFKKNPVMLFNHKSWGDKYVGPIGRWKEPKKSGSVLSGTSVFDIDDETGKSVARKVDEDFIKGCSMGFQVIETSTDAKYLLPGQAYPTVTKCRLVEVSICDIPSNSECLALYDDQGNMTILNGPEDLVKLSMFQPINPDTQSTDNNMKLSIAILTLLGLPADATEEQAVEKLTALKNSEAQLKTNNATLTGELKTLRDGKVVTLVDAAIASKKITQEQRETYITLANADFAAAEKALGAMQAPVKPTEVINLGGGKGNGAAGDDRSKWTFEDWRKKDTKGLLKLKADNPETYQQLLDAEKAKNPNYRF